MGLIESTERTKKRLQDVKWIIISFYLGLTVRMASEMSSLAQIKRFKQKSDKWFNSCKSWAGILSEEGQMVGVLLTSAAAAA